jgi:hypothetical protein
LNGFGELLVKALRDEPIGLYEDLAQGRLIGRGWKPLHEGLAALTEEQRGLVRRVVIAAAECGIDQFLQGIRHSGLSILVDGQEIGTSDVDLIGRLLGQYGWTGRFSEYPAEAPQNAPRPPCRTRRPSRPDRHNGVSRQDGHPAGPVG